MQIELMEAQTALQNARIALLSVLKRRKTCYLKETLAKFVAAKDRLEALELRLAQALS